MKSLFWVLALLLSLGLFPTLALADLTAPQSTPENAELAAGRKAIDAKDYKAAVGHLTKAVQEDPNNADAHTMLGFSYRKLGTFDKSMDSYQRALKIDANNRSAHEYLGELYLEMNQPDNAEKQLVVLKKACPFFGKCEEYDDLKEAIEKYKTTKK
jgi:Tfp pilus assembly protein PilF